MRYLWLVLVLLAAPVIGWAQPQGKRGAEPLIEEELRQHLRKLDRWGIVQLLRVEKAVDEKQKKRAKSTKGSTTKFGSYNEGPMAIEMRNILN